MVWLLPLPSAGLETQVRRSPGPISGAAAARGVSARVPSLGPAPSSGLAGRRPALIDVSPQENAVSLPRDRGGAAFLPRGAAVSRPAADT